ncbi:MAG TPA: anti-sigma factor [Actinocrinis sp.]|uniref:anti-sigma factor n=1 Tax=Actinocrinis sp. TaxID=1920516 RepID=UPI002DDD2A63|nr:anti-sigma factor [Actinocrinis sp.]HEV3173659.1 anti-sigma factor [Actinocrinis sp.]
MSAAEPETHALIGAYACDALDPAARAAFEQHLLECPTCRLEVDELREVTAALAEAFAVEPPDGLRAAVDAEIAVTRQLPSVVTPITVPRGRRPLARAAWAGWAAAAVLAGVVAVLSVVDSGQQGRINTISAQASSLASLLSQPDVRSSVGRVDTGGLATVVASRDRDEAAIILSGLAAPPAGKVYQVWIIGPEGTRSGGLVPPGAGGSSPIFAPGLGDARTVALTVEPARGSAQPTTTPVLMLAIPG